MQQARASGEAWARMDRGDQNEAAGRSWLGGGITLTDRRRTAFEFALLALRNAIVTGQIPGGTHLGQTALAQELGVSTTPIREALRQLASEGLVDFDSHKGAVVRKIDVDDMREVYILRLLLEPHCMRLAAGQIQPAVLARAEDLHRRMVSEHDVGAWAEINREFHGTLCDSVRSPRLVGFLQTLRGVDSLYTGVGLRAAPHPMEAGNQDHGQLLDALRRGDGDDAAAVSAAHIQAIIDLL